MVHSLCKSAWSSEALDLSFIPTLNYWQILPSSKAHGAESPHSNLRSIPLFKTVTWRKWASRRGASYPAPLYSLSKKSFLVALLQLGSELFLDAAQHPCKGLTIAAALRYIVCKSENSWINIIFITVLTILLHLACCLLLLSLLLLWKLKLFPYSRRKRNKRYKKEEKKENRHLSK